MDPGCLWIFKEYDIRQRNVDIKYLWTIFSLLVSLKNFSFLAFRKLNINRLLFHKDDNKILCELVPMTASFLC